MFMIGYFLFGAAAGFVLGAIFGKKVLAKSQEAITKAQQAIDKNNP